MKTKTQNTLNENFEKVKNQIELEISNGKIPLDTHHLDFDKLAEYFDCSYLLNGCTSDKMASDVIDLVDDYLEFDCSITWSIQNKTMKTKTQITTSNTEQLIYSMLTENTGTHMLDSGGDNGRMWQRNANKSLQDFADAPAEIYQYDTKYNEIHRTVSVFHFLTNDLFVDDIAFNFNELNTNAKDWDADCIISSNFKKENDASLYGVSVNAWLDLVSSNEVEVSRSWNTYNGDSDLSQILQGATLTINNEHYVLIQIHGGADARGGYTDAKLFKIPIINNGMINEYLREYADNYEVLEELEYIDSMVDYWDESIIYKGKKLEAIKIKLNN